MKITIKISKSIKDLIDSDKLENLINKILEDGLLSAEIKQITIEKSKCRSYYGKSFCYGNYFLDGKIKIYVYYLPNNDFSETHDFVQVFLHECWHSIQHSWYNEKFGLACSTMRDFLDDEADIIAYKNFESYKNLNPLII